MKSYNIIDSVKGGSGKTSLSLMLALAYTHAKIEQAKTEQAKTENLVTPKETTSKQGTPALILDMDMQGSSLADLLFGQANPGQDNLAANYLNSRILNYYQGNRAAKEYISHPIFQFQGSFQQPEDGSQKNYLRIAAAVASPKSQDRNKFRSLAKTNYSSVITYQSFHAGLQDVLETLDSSLPDQLETVFFDMPPNSNGYSDSVLEILLNDGSPFFRRCRVNYFELTTLDFGHIQASLKWFKSFVEENQYHFPSHFFFVFNNVPEDIALMAEDTEPPSGKIIVAEEPYRRLCDDLKNFMQSSYEHLLKRVFFVGVKYQAEYLQACCKTNAIGCGLVPLPETLVTPISFLKDINGNDVLPKDSVGKDFTTSLLEKLEE